MKPIYNVGMVWTPSTSNTKTGPIITAAIGHSVQEMRGTCAGCPLAPAPINDDASSRETPCYAWRGNVIRGFVSQLKAATNNASNTSMVGTDAVKKGGRYSIENAIANRDPRAKAARIGSIGDGARANKTELYRAVRMLRRVHLAVLMYTHHWRSYLNRGLKRVAMASCNNLTEADAAINAGWIPAAVVPGTSHKSPEDLARATVTTPDGNTLVMCPAQRAEDVTCNNCKLCDPLNPFWKKVKGIFSGIGFFQH